MDFLFAQMGRDLCLNTINIFIKTSMDGQKKYMNVRTAPAVLIAKNVVRKKKETEQQVWLFVKHGVITYIYKFDDRYEGQRKKRTQKIH